ncbi:hypothetical protein KIW84_063863 [Lathyrus oleraceus]|uniref:Uncharacterized protein n=1 Tax=Pisum sativum TaxID=3888 RepID=A0A9D4W8Q9_PEA|nr:hypothetical protein KIW84_063863 [Pisum sativum]
MYGVIRVPEIEDIRDIIILTPPSVNGILKRRGTVFSTSRDGHKYLVIDEGLLQLNGKITGPHMKGADLGFLYVVPDRSPFVIFQPVETT